MRAVTRATLTLVWTGLACTACAASHPRSAGRDGGVVRADAGPPRLGCDAPGCTTGLCCRDTAGYYCCDANRCDEEDLYRCFCDDLPACPNDLRCCPHCEGYPPAECMPYDEYIARCPTGVTPFCPPPPDAR